MKKILTLLHDDFEDLEFWYPLLRVQEAGYTVVIAGEAAHHTYHGKYGVPAVSDITYEEALGQDYAGLLIPGGWAPDKIRRFPAALEIVRTLNEKGRIIGQICHAGWVTISAGILEGKNVTSTPGIKDDMENAGGLWYDKAVVVHDNLVSSRRPPDLPEYMQAFLAAL
ncbi:type 1 glutamine amidotransferase domain-containing protein [Chitinivibrio alkaliphilus]|uniref:Intracellular protease, PfpI family n=1 Tax=Chitinivibrio alkaliphilus ACht1 TaxID=1313304 RepID=U7D857_9BACT|nr:type 1 glutamine amidotransferase domain-containing protein [Chitinivibrio alkaliphilus]ERP31756.1 intracellular protease, PfpI family [Chitinivibrio alkaliphilus ACht1]